MQARLAVALLLLPVALAVPGPWVGSHTKVACNTAHLTVVYDGMPVWPSVARVIGYEAWLDNEPYGKAEFYEDGKLVGSVESPNYFDEEKSAYRIMHEPMAGDHEVTVRIRTAGALGECTARASMVFTQLWSGLTARAGHA
ncbi:hypothetical protein HYS54_02280 [Candidatus Micrarchaeota archaeon]|nr:hypothetical protein [Candidatus Micrarchaeota archaeon]